MGERDTAIDHITNFQLRFVSLCRSLKGKTIQNGNRATEDIDTIIIRRLLFDDSNYLVASFRNILTKEHS
jgi:hypothetical protein